MALVMADGKDSDSVWQDSIKDSIREALHLCFATAKGSQRKGLWIGLDQAKNTLSLLEKLISQPLFALIISAANFLDLSLPRFVITKYHDWRRFAKCAMNSW